jgi:hypothetical protein
MPPHNRTAVIPPPPGRKESLLRTVMLNIDLAGRGTLRILDTVMPSSSDVRAKALSLARRQMVMGVTSDNGVAKPPFSPTAHAQAYLRRVHVAGEVCEVAPTVEDLSPLLRRAALPDQGFPVFDVQIAVG